MPDNDDVTKDWRATQGQHSAATRLRIFAALCWVVAIGGEIAGIVLLRQHKFDHGNLPLLIGILVGIAIFAIGGSLMWKAANKQDPARQADTARFFFQNQLGAIMTVIAFLPLLVLIFMDKDMDPKNKKIAGGLGAVLAVGATLIGLLTRGRRPGAGHRQGLQHRRRGNQGRRTPGWPGRRLLDRSRERSQEGRDPARLPPLPGGQPAQRQDRQSRLRHGSLCGERHPHHQADPDGTKAVRVR
jgi:hypothetical protein